MYLGVTVVLKLGRGSLTVSNGVQLGLREGFCVVLRCADPCYRLRRGVIGLIHAAVAAKPLYWQGWAYCLYYWKYRKWNLCLVGWSWQRLGRRDWLSAIAPAAEMAYSSGDA